MLPLPWPSSAFTHCSLSLSGPGTPFFSVWTMASASSLTSWPPSRPFPSSLFPTWLLTSTSDATLSLFKILPWVPHYHQEEAPAAQPDSHDPTHHAITTPTTTQACYLPYPNPPGPLLPPSLCTKCLPAQMTPPYFPFLMDSSSDLEPKLPPL